MKNELEIQQTLTTTTATTSSPTNPNNSNGGLSFSNGVFTALISDASTWNVDSKTEDSCEELRIYPPASMLESRKVTDDGPVYPASLGGSFNPTKSNDRQFSVEPPIGIKQTNKTSGYSLDFERTSDTWPVRITSWPKRGFDDAVIENNFSFYEPDAPRDPMTGDLPSIGSVKYSNPKRGTEELCRLGSGADSDCRLRRINRENKDADGSTIGGTA